MSQHPMSRPPSDNIFQVSFKIPDKWIALADRVASAMSRPGIATTRTDVLRAALIRGLEALEAEHSKSSKPSRK